MQRRLDALMISLCRRETLAELQLEVAEDRRGGSTRGVPPCRTLPSRKGLVSATLINMSPYRR